MQLTNICSNKHLRHTICPECECLLVTECAILNSTHDHHQCYCVPVWVNEAHLLEENPLNWLDKIMYIGRNDS